ncbi:MAG: SPL family radical SAM protein [Nitrososphaeraceae archaeon]
MVVVTMEIWYDKKGPDLVTKNSKSIIHPFIVKGHKGLTINPYQGCQHRCGYCYATYEWSPEFYDKIYAKSNAAEVLENQLKSWKSETIEPVMVSSATDPYQPAEIRYGLTRKCIEVLQEYNVPYYVFTKSTIISRDLFLHERYKDNCFFVWSITTCNEKIRRIIEPGTPPAYHMFSVIRKFTDAGIKCGVNIDPILPLITDSQEEIEAILDNCNRCGVGYVFGALLRLRSDIWKRMQIILKLLDVNDGIEIYKKRIYQFTEPLKPSYNIAASESYSSKVLQNLENKVSEKGMFFDFPDFIGGRRIKADKKNHHHNTNNKNDNYQQITLMTYM